MSEEEIKHDDNAKDEFETTFNSSFLNEKENVAPFQTEEVIPEAETGKTEPEPAKEAPKAEKDHHVPLHVMLDQRERAQKAERQAEQYQRDLENLRRQLEASKPKEQEEIPDAMIDPQAYSAWVQKQIDARVNDFQQKQLAQKIEYSLQSARETDQERFDAAYNALDPRDTATVNRIKNAYDPGKELMRWYAQQETLRETGGDIHSFREKERAALREQLKNDPEYRAEILAMARAEAATSPPTRPAHNGMPSITRAPSSRGTTNPMAAMSPQEAHASSLNLKR